MRYYFIDTLGNLDDEDLCIVDETPRGMGVHYTCMVYGRPARDNYPDNAELWISDYDDRRDASKLETLLGTTNAFLLLHGSAKAVIEAHANVEIEYLPFRLLTHDGKLLSDEYFFINPIGTRDCLSYELSEINYYDEDPSKIISIDRLVLDPKKLEDEPMMFRVREDPAEYVISGSLLTLLRRHEFTNVHVREIELAET